jgi:hypothetical protein
MPVTTGHAPVRIENAVVAVYGTHAEAEQGVRDLASAGFDMKKLSIVGKDYQTEEGVVGYYTTGDRMKAWGKSGAFWGSLWGMLVGGAFFVIPGVGPLFVAGPLVMWIVGAIEGAAIVGGVSALSAGLISLGIPKSSVIEYETAIKAGRFVLLAHGTDADAADARTALSKTTHVSLTSHACHPA